MRLLARLGLATMGFALAVPVAARADDDDAPVTRAVVVQVPPHKHTGKLKLKPHLCEKCAAAKPAPVAANGMPLNMQGAKIVSCSHNPNSVCKECQALLAMPGTMMVAGQGSPAQAAPGRAVVSGNEAEPMGVMQTNYMAQGAPAGEPAPGRASVNSGSPGRAPFMSPTSEPSPHILGHLFGISEVRNDLHDWAGARGRRKRDAHAAIPYGPDASRVDELPASMVFGKGPR